MTRPRRWAVTLTVAGLIGLVGGCGIPDNTVVVPRGLAPSAGVAAGGVNSPSKPRRMDTNNRAEFVRNYLEAAAGDPDSAEVPDEVRDFLAPAAAKTFKPGQGIRVVRLTEEPLVDLNTGWVTVWVQQVGTLGADGILEPSGGAITPYKFVVGELPGNSGLFITEAPQNLLLSDTALNKFYTRRTIYFWNRDHTSLVPDLRYLSLAVPREQQPTQVIEWLANGPAQWLGDAVEPLPDGTKSLGNVPAGSGEKLQIDLSGQAVPAEDSKAALDRLGRQLMWSLRPNLATVPALELRIAGQVVGDFIGEAYLTSNAAYRFTSTTPEQFCVYDGRIRRLAQSANSAAPIPAVPDNVNRNVQTAALSSSAGMTYAALVVSEAGRPALRVGSAATGTPASFRRIGLKSPIGRPTWAVTPNGTEPGTAVGLITAAGQLYSFGPRGVGGAREVDWPGGPGNVTGVSVAPDGHRIAVVAGGRLYLAVMTGSGSGVQLSAPEEVRTLLRDVTAVDWGSESTLVLAGAQANKRSAVAYVSIDGASQTDRLDDLGTARVTDLVAYPANPVNLTDDPPAMAYVADRVAYNVLKDPERIVPNDLAGPLPNPLPAAGPTAPFFLY